MAITVTQQPSKVVLNGNAVLLEVQSDSAFTAGAKEIFRIDFIDGNEDDVLTLDWGEISLILTLKDSPDNSGNQISSKGDETTDAWLLILVQQLANNYFINKDFVPEKDPNNNSINLVARTTGADKSIAFTSSTVDIIDGGHTVAGTDDVYAENFNFLAFLNMQGNTYTLESRPIKDTSIFNLSKLLSGFNTLALPPFNGSTISDADALLAAYSVKVAERFGYFGSVKKMVDVGEDLKSLHGGLPHFVFPEKDFYTDELSGGKLMRLSNSKRLHENQQELVYYYHDNAATSFDVNATVYLKDGTTSTDTVYNNVTTAKGGLHCIPTRFELLEVVFGVAANLISKIEIWTSAQNTPGTVFSQILTYNMHQGATKDDLTLLYRTSLGVYEVFMATEFQTHSASVAKQVNAIKLPLDYSRETQPHFEAESRYTTTINANTVWQTRQEQQLFLDLLKSKEVYLADGFWQPVTVKAGKQKLFDTDSGSFNGSAITITTKEDSYV